MMRNSANRLKRGVGEGNLGCIIWLLILGALVLVLWKFVPVKIHTAQLNDYVSEQAQFVSRKDTSESIKKRILNKAAELNLEIDPKQIKVVKTKKSVTVEMNYVIPLEFPGYTYELEVDETIVKQIFDF